METLKREKPKEDLSNLEDNKTSYFCSSLTMIGTWNTLSEYRTERYMMIHITLTPEYAWSTSMWPQDLQHGCRLDTTFFQIFGVMKSLTIIFSR